MIRAIHIEDETRNIELLSSLVKEHCPDIDLVAHARNLPDAIQLVNEVQPDLVYLDIELNEGNAFDLLDSFSNIEFQVIFITAYNNYAVKAFRFNAVDYLLKPISIAELREATTKAVERIENRSGTEQLTKLLKQIRQETQTQKIGLPVSDGIQFIQISEITRIEAKGGSTLVFLASKKPLISVKSLKELEKMLPDPPFIRVHHSFIINLNFCRKYYRGKNGYMEMEDGAVVPISVRKKGDFLSSL